MEGLIAAIQPFVGFAVFIGLMLLMHGGHGGHAGHDTKPARARSAEQDETASRGAHQHG